MNVDFVNLERGMLLNMVFNASVVSNNSTTNAFGLTQQLRHFLFMQ